ncbi:hypothetical protein SDC9_153014 [bioreactor metagenome]|uniref:Uncharacterized protein n=1 Tax=bioreactor metagenome TaxID=1076179 RepID=A0A645EUR0_9ZZZZ
MPSVCWRFVISEVERVIIEDIPKESNCCSDNSCVFLNSFVLISLPNNDPKSLVTQLPIVEIMVVSIAKISIDIPTLITTLKSLFKIPLSIIVATNFGISKVPPI